jgi:5-dehydro-2-deoxygluconokinase
VVLLGLDAPQEALASAFAIAKPARTVRGFAVGRTIFGDAARAWFNGQMGDEAAVDDMAGRFAALVEVWERA